MVWLTSLKPPNTSTSVVAARENSSSTSLTTHLSMAGGCQVS